MRLEVVVMPAQAVAYRTRSHADRSGRRRCQSVLVWKARPMRTSVASANGAPMSCIPIGKPSAENPAGSDNPQAPSA